MNATFLAVFGASRWTVPNLSKEDLEALVAYMVSLKKK